MSEFAYPDEALGHLMSLGPEMARAVGLIGRVTRTYGGDPFCMLVKSIVGQQISTKAQEAVWGRLIDALGAPTPEKVVQTPVEALRAFGLSEKKAIWIKTAAQKACSGELDFEAVRTMPDEAAVEVLTALPGVGRWTAEMLLIFAYGRMDVLSIGDFGVRRGLGMIYGRTLSPKELREEKRRASPWGTVAALTAWAAASGAYPEFREPEDAAKPASKSHAPKRRKRS